MGLGKKGQQTFEKIVQCTYLECIMIGVVSLPQVLLEWVNKRDRSYKTRSSETWSKSTVGITRLFTFNE